MTAVLDGGPCFCCRRRDDGIGAMRGRRIVWSCNDHIHLAQGALSMPKRELDTLEQRALSAAGDAAGAYLDRIGKTDLASLDEVQWVTFLRTVVDTFGADLAERLSSHEAPF